MMSCDFSENCLYPTMDCTARNVLQAHHDALQCRKEGCCMLAYSLHVKPSFYCSICKDEERPSKTPCDAAVPAL